MRAALILLLAAAYVVALIPAQSNACSDHAAEEAEDPSSCADGESPDLDPVVKQWIMDLDTDSSYIGGRWVKSEGSEDTIRVIDPSAGNEIAKVRVASKDDVDLAVKAARKAWSSWSFDTPLSKRRELVSRLLDLYNEQDERMAQLMSHEMGSPITEAREAQVGSGSFAMEQFLYETDDGDFEETFDIGGDTAIIHESIGVAALITPWNWPMSQVALKVIPALLVGCTVVLKPSEEAPLSALLFGQMIHAAGFPPGVFNLVNGYGRDHVGEWLSSHPGVDMVSFTGSTRAGREVSASAAPTLKRVSLEMGGKGANIIFDDVIGDDGDMSDFRSAVEEGVYDAMNNSGQTCNAPTRLLVPEEHWQYALDVARDAALATEVASSHDEGDHIGPVVSLAQYERVQRYIRLGIEEGATLIAGGPGKPIAPDDDPDLQRTYDSGYYVRPTLFANCTKTMTVWREEIFGPVLCVTPYRTEDEAVGLANDTPYGLTNYVHTYDETRRRRLARKLRSGMVVFNGVGQAPNAPFGGVGQSGNSREGGVWGLEDYCVAKSVSGMNTK